MPKRNILLNDGKLEAGLRVRVTPRAGRNKIVEVMSDQVIKVHVAAAPVDGEANEKLVKFLAEILDVPKSRIEIVAGLSSREKLISVLGLDTETVYQRIAAQID